MDKDGGMKTDQYLEGLWKRDELSSAMNKEKDAMTTEPPAQALHYCNGLLCVQSLLSDFDPLSIYNPITRDSAMLPSTLKLGNGRAFLGFGLDSKSKVYKLVRLLGRDPELVDDYGTPSYMEGEIITLGECWWRSLDVSFVVDGIEMAAIFSNGAFHWVIDKTYHTSGMERILVA
ncbi:hypothetical protein GIB67_020904 [Kingdonia uniflora]|uniref:F-box associated beta-propeller type 3 domain-containing protein n=1 Tax=Kingdonia uniflora TaxID=39325 RepID=A0A7J7M7F1_9MAGN|nr:hypothetical protein GIB67_020904 [Kingdonia uniflora]